MKKLLFVEDEIITGTVFKNRFATAGYQVRLVDNGPKCIGILAEFKPDIVLLDLTLPRINGLEILRNIRSQPETKSLPVVVLTNAYARETNSAAESAGANKCLIKASTTVEQVFRTVRDILEEFTASVVPDATPVPNTPKKSAEPQPVISMPLDPRAEFLKNTPQELTHLRALSQALLKAEQGNVRAGVLFDLYKAVHELTAKASLAKAPLFAQMASAIEALLKELDDKPQKVDASTMRTVHQSIEFLDLLAKTDISRTQDEWREFKILAVDDEVLSLRAVSVALERAHLKSISIEDPLAALELLKNEPFDLVITDVNMPGMGGFDLSTKLQSLPGRSKTPVIFVTSLNGFDARVRSAQSGGSDFIAKPFVPVELVVKALTHILRGQLNTAPPGFQAFSPALR